MTEHAEAADPTVRVYFTADDDLDVAWRDEPPVGSLDGWHAVDVPVTTWERAREARDEHRRATERQERATTALDGALDRLWRDAGVGRVLGRTR